MTSHLSELAQAAATVARLGGAVLKRFFGQITIAHANTKRPFDFVSEADHTAEQTMTSFIKDHFPEDTIYAEEGSRQEAGSGNRWIIDPLDGTTNFLHGYPMFSVSVAVESGGQVIAGAVLDPLRDELFVAERGRGAYLNGVRLKVSSINDPARSLLATGFPFRSKDLLQPYLRTFAFLFERVSGIRRAGSAALDLAYVACGRCEGFWELGLSPWDIAAGELLIQEAGGRVTDFDGSPSAVWRGNVIASNGLIHDLILEAVALVFGTTSQTPSNQ
ncbi:MAG: inositol monophosphatase [candidate division KSB1 bacterium]|nr:inositol monophosphatase [candidate division KSB1 bacterium]